MPDEGPSFRVPFGSMYGRLAEKRILFAHQSVGAEIVRGVLDIRENRAGTVFRVVESRIPDALSAPGLCHCRIGRNADPASKISDFERLMDAGFGETTDLAFLKLCYVDMATGVDIEDVFRLYRESFTRLTGKFPDVVFLHVTVPVVRESGTARAILQKLAMRTDRRREDNASRGRFSELMIHEYGVSGTVFDLASIESGIGSGELQDSSNLRRLAGPLMASYTYDGFHLNVKGRKIVADALLSTLSRFAG